MNNFEFKEDDDSIVKVENEILNLRRESTSTLIGGVTEDRSNPSLSETKNQAKSSKSFSKSRPALSNSKGLKYYCHMPRCGKKSFKSKRPYSVHLKYHQLPNAFGCCICHSLNSNMQVIMAHIEKKHGIHKPQAMKLVYREKSDWIEPPGDSNSLVSQTTSSAPSNSAYDHGIIVVKHKKKVVQTINVNGVNLPNNVGPDKIKEDISAFANDGLFDFILGCD